MVPPALSSPVALLSGPRLLVAAQNGDPEALRRVLASHEQIVQAITRDYWAPGGSRDDLLQVGRTGLWQAIHDFRPELGVPFKHFAATCVRREIMNELTRARRHKHQVLTDARSIHHARGEQEVPLEDTLTAVAERHDPVARLEQLELLSELAQRMRGLSDLERRCLLIQAGGGRHEDMVCELAVPRKTADNALQRARRKIAGV